MQLVGKFFMAHQHSAEDCTLWDSAPCLVDAHVHLHDKFDLNQFLAIVGGNISRRVTEASLPTNSVGVLMLTDLATIDSFERILRTVAIDSEWKCHTTAEQISLLLEHRLGQRLVVVSGRQVATAEGLEVLALGTRDNFEDGNSISDTVERLTVSNAIVVVPWGLGKWLGKRGHIIDELIAATERFPNLRFGDNGNRPTIWRYPAALAKARIRGRQILSGSDPLPLDAAIAETGRFGFVGPQQLNLKQPFKHIVQWLDEMPGTPRPYGKPQPTLRALDQQLRLRLERKFAKPTGSEDAGKHLS